MHNPASLETYVAQNQTAPERAYMESALIIMDLALAGEMTSQIVVR